MCARTDTRISDWGVKQKNETKRQRARTSAHTNTVWMRTNPDDDSMRVKLIQYIHNKPNRVNKAQHMKASAAAVLMDGHIWEPTVTTRLRHVKESSKISTTRMTIATNTYFIHCAHLNRNPAMNNHRRLPIWLMMRKNPGVNQILTPMFLQIKVNFLSEKKMSLFKSVESSAAKLDLLNLWKRCWP